METFISETEKILAKKGIGAALKRLDELDGKEIGDLSTEILTLKGRYSRHIADVRMGVISRSEENLETNKITRAFLAILEELKTQGSHGTSSRTEKPAPDATTPPSSASTVRKILFLASNPTDTGRLRLGAELRDISEGLKLSAHRDSFNLESRFAVRAKDLSRAMLEEEPQIIHFSGHGVLVKAAQEAEPGSRSLDWEELEDPETLEGLSGGIALEDSEGNAKIVRAEALGGLFELFGEKVECVFLNACYSDAQAEAIIKHVPYVVGMNTAVPDNTAIAFATGFYDALGAGRDIEFSFKLAKNRIDLEGMPGADIPVLRKRE